MMQAIREIYELYGFEAVETPFIEYTEALGKFLPDQDRPNEGVFSFQDDDEQWLSLRYDLTAPLARYVAENFDKLPKPYRSYRSGFVFRNEKPGPGRFRQFMQFDADTVGAASVAADAEICMMAADAHGAPRRQARRLRHQGQQPQGARRRAGSRGLEGEGRGAQKLIVLRAIDKLDRLGAEGVRMLLGAGRKDESGDFTKGADLSSAAIDRILAFTVRARRRQRHDAAAPRRGGRRKRARPRRRRGTRRDGLAVHGWRLRRRARGDRPLRRARPRILHRPRLRGRTHLPGEGRARPPDALRLGGRRRALRRPRRALPRRARARDRLLHRRVAPARRAAGDQVAHRHRERAAGPRRGAGDGPRGNRPLPGLCRDAARGGHPRRIVSGRARA